MAKLRVQGDTSGYVDLAAPDVAGSTTVDLGQIPQKDENNTFNGYTTFTENVKIDRTADSASSRLLIDGAANQQSGIQINRAGAEKSVIYRPSNSDNLHVYMSSGGDTLKFMQGGYMLKPKQPIISGQMGTAQTHPTAGIVLKFNEFWVNQGGISYNSSNGRFTVPYTGIYRITFNPFVYNAAGNFRVYIGKNTESPSAGSGGHIGHCYTNGNTYDTLCLDSVVSLAANDYIVFKLHQGRIYNQNTDRFNQFSIELIG